MVNMIFFFSLSLSTEVSAVYSSESSTLGLTSDLCVMLVSTVQW